MERHYITPRLRHVQAYGTADAEEPRVDGIDAPTLAARVAAQVFACTAAVKTAGAR